MISPFINKLNFIKIQVLTISECATIGLYVGIIVAALFFTISIINLVIDYKTRILEARRGIFRDFHLDKLEVQLGASMPGFLISNSIMAYGLVVISVTLVITLLCYPLFWEIIWSLIFILVPIILSMVIKELLDGYITD